MAESPLTTPIGPPHGAGLLLEVRDLSVAFRTEHGVVWAVDSADLSLPSAGTLGIVGESGSGKSVTALSIIRLIPPSGRVMGGSIRYRGEELLTAPQRRLDRIRGSEIGFVFSDPMLSLNPAMTIEEQLTEGPRIHLGLRPEAARARARTVLDRVGISDAPRRLRQYPHELSGGMRQRVMIAIAISCDVRLLIADEPTTALDVTVQAAVVDLLGELQRDLGMALILISHDLDLVAAVCDQIAVMYAGRVIETGPASEVVTRPEHPYTQGLLACNPHHTSAGGRLPSIPGSPAVLTAPWTACAFQPRCSVAVPDCLAEAPRFKPAGTGGQVRCLVAGASEPRATDLEGAD